MKNIILVSIFLIISIVLVGVRYKTNPGTVLGLNNESKKLLEHHDNAVWDWTSLKNTQHEKFISDLATKGISVIYLDIGRYIDLHETQASEQKDQLLLEFENNLINYLGTAEMYGITVHALAGAAHWGNSSHRYLNELIVEYVHGFNLRHPDYQFTGIQFDIEPYNQASFNDKSEVRIYTDFLNTVEEIITLFKENFTDEQHTPELGFAIPYWFDGENDNIKKISWNGEEKFIYHHLLNRLNTAKNGYIVLMSYRNKAEGIDGVIEHSRNEIVFANTYTPRIKIVIGQETSDVKPSKITYFNSDFDTMLGEIKKIATELEVYENFGGFAFNDANTFIDLQ